MRTRLCAPPLSRTTMLSQQSSSRRSGDTLRSCKTPSALVYTIGATAPPPVDYSDGPETFQPSDGPTEDPELVLEIHGLTVKTASLHKPVPERCDGWGEAPAAWASKQPGQECEAISSDVGGGKINIELECVLEQGGKFVQTVKYGCELVGMKSGPPRAPLRPLNKDAKRELATVVPAHPRLISWRRRTGGA